MPLTAKGGWRDWGLCPFHDDNHDLDEGAYVCFSCGAKGSDIVDYTMARDGIDFQTALRKLAREWGV